MAHPEIVNQTGMHVGLVAVSDHEGTPVLAIITKGTFLLVDGAAQLAAEQRELCYAGVPTVDAEIASYRYEPETAYFKPSTDVVLIGHAYTGNQKSTQVDVSLRVGPVFKCVRVFGDRYWEKKLGMVGATPPRPFERIPLVYERAFGGWDSSKLDPATSRFEARNPVGRGFKRHTFEEGMPLPNLEDPKHLLSRYGDTPPPAGFGFISPDWFPRAALAGTYDKAWQENRAPRLPLDFDPRYFNAASAGLVTPHYLIGDEQVEVLHATDNGKLQFHLPGLRAPTIDMHVRRRKCIQLHSVLDTVIINTDEMILFLLWRAHCAFPYALHDVSTITASR